MATKKMRITGARQVGELLKKLPGPAAQRAVRNGLNGGARVIRSEAQANLASSGAIDTGRLRGRTGALMPIYQKQGSDVANRVTVTLRASSKLTYEVRRGRTKPTAVRPSKYAHLVEYGTEHSAAKPFFRPAVASKNAEAVAKISDLTTKSIAREAAKLGFKIRFT